MLRFLRIHTSYFSTNKILKHTNPLGLPKKGEKVAPTFKAKVEKIKIPNVRNIIAISSAKGGVGKSTTTVNLATVCKQLNLKVGILDADLFGPSIPKLMNLYGEPELDKNGSMIPLVNYGVHCISMGNLIDEEQAVVWRGMMVMKALQQLIYQTKWPELDILFIDMPPGTGDTQLTISQLVPLNGSIIISTPQDIALIDVKKGIKMYEKVNVKILGILQNMSQFECPNCKSIHYIFGKDGVKTLALSKKLQLLEDLPLSMEVAKLADKGTPITIVSPESFETKIYKNIMEKVWKQLNK
ncbi:P-loop containing nucleoside triphosphate hydrolase protein [Neoconidiobolus thromboides FSU 785]|nr:P-loop containing nucleoside triphosphate hydrolase protein [Neoconidiobolus thromboides FSU 785]